jgi:hypothetical protein
MGPMVKKRETNSGKCSWFEGGQTDGVDLAPPAPPAPVSNEN